ncbi:WD40 repeat domain-containing protein [Oligoflexus tunisiensis]|uniref:WD40 repeat domain-containing protein n=1 Tax=Oligoflexus tunisiensis TaxID=708132 RepID=UPI001C406F55|nr:WD40 repeat domain-containing protein [Oligoflexus tunisiensis]
MISVASLACTRFSNQHDRLALDCGLDFEGSNPVTILDPDGKRLPGSDLEAFVFLTEEREPLVVSSKGCVERPSAPVLIRHRNRPLGFVGELAGGPAILRRPEEPRLKVTCSPEKSVRSELNLQDYLNLKDAAQRESYELIVNLSDESGLQPIFHARVNLRSQTLGGFPLPENLPEGPVHLSLTLHDLIRRESDPVQCLLNMDRTPPQPTVEVEATADHVRGPQILTEVDDRRTLQLTTNEGQLFYCLQSGSDAPCEPNMRYEKPINLSAWQGEVVVRYLAVDAAGNASTIMSRNLLIVNSFQENEVASLAASSRAVAGKSVQTMLDSLRAEEKRQLLPSVVQRDRQSLSTYWALLKNYMAPQAPLLTVPYSESKTVAYWNDMSLDGEWLCYADLVKDQVHLLHLVDQKKTTLPMSGTGCRLSHDGSQMLVVNLGVEDSAYLVQLPNLTVKKLPAIPARVISKIYLGEQNQVFLLGRHQLLKWTSAHPDSWETLYELEVPEESDEELEANFGERELVLWFKGGMRVFDLKSFQEKAEIMDQVISMFSNVIISPDGQMLMVLPTIYSGRPIAVWMWNESKKSYERTLDFDPHQPQTVFNATISPRNEEVILEHGNGTASYWSFSDGNFVLRNKSLVVPGDIIQNLTDSHYPRGKFLSHGRIGIISSSKVSMFRTQQAGMVLASDMKEIVVDDQGKTVLTQDANGNVKIFDFDGMVLKTHSELHKFPSHVRSRTLYLSASGQLAGVDVDGKLKLWKRDDAGFKPLEHPAAGVKFSGLALSDDGRSIAVGERREEETFVSVWFDGYLQNTRSDFCTPPDSIFPKDARALRFSPQGDNLLISCDYGEAQVWNLKDDRMVTIGPDIAIRSSLFHENGLELIFDNGSVMQTQTFSLHMWKEDSGIQAFSFNTAPIQAIAGSRDFRLIASLSESDLVFWNPELNDGISVWESMKISRSSNERLAIASTTLRTFALNEHNELVYWSLSASDIYKNLCSELKPQIHALNLQNSVCTHERL